MLFLRATATGWVDDEPHPGLVSVEIVDADGVVHRLLEKCSAIDAGLGPRTRYPVEVSIACAARDQGYRRADNATINVVDLSPWGVGDPEATYAVEPDRLRCVSPLQHADLSVAARQAAGIVTFRRWREAVGLQGRAFATLEDHLSQYASVTQETFEAWFCSHRLTRRRPGQRLPWALRRAVAARGLDQDAVAHAVLQLVQITYDGIYGGIESAMSLARLHELESVTTGNGVPLASADDFAGSLWIDDDWGRPEADVLERWRQVR